jgi:diguanylate cyclase (GGDEF)-like protein
MTRKKVNADRFPPGQLRILLTLARDLLQTDEADGSFRLIGRALAEIVRPEAALLLLNSHRLQLVGFDRYGAPRPAGADHPLYRSGMPLLSGPDGQDAPDEGGRQVEPGGRRTLSLAVPAQGAVAVLVVAWQHDLDAAELDKSMPALSYILQLIAAAMGKIEAYGSLERQVSVQRAEMANTSVTHAAELARRDQAAAALRVLSLTDVLTGLYNRRGFFLQAEQIYKLARRERTKSAVIFADIDGLKRVNDELGHDAGDHLIRDAASIFLASFREADVVARLGGDEFVAYTLGEEHPIVILHRIQAKLRAFNLMGERQYAVSISAGVVQCDANGERTLADYVLLADQQMYVQKRSRLH